VEFWLFLTPRARARLDPAAWCAKVAPVSLVVRNEFGTHVAFFPGPVRGEFHFAVTADIASVGQWPHRGAPVARMLIVDRDGELAPVLAALPAHPPLPGGPDEIAELCGRFANWLVLALHVTARGERLRAQDALAHAARHLLWMARLAEHSTAHWLTPSRAAESELPARTVRAVASGDPAAYWREGRDRWRALLAEHGGTEPAVLFAELDALTGLADPP
jgi:lincosamide nucleotidyltransferase